MLGLTAGQGGPNKTKKQRGTAHAITPRNQKVVIKQKKNVRCEKNPGIAVSGRIIADPKRRKPNKTRKNFRIANKNSSGDHSNNATKQRFHIATYDMRSHTMSGCMDTETSGIHSHTMSGYEKRKESCLI